VERDLQIIDELGLKLTQTANTHCHADHITGSGKIKVRSTGCVRLCSRRVDVGCQSPSLIPQGRGTVAHVNGLLLNMQALGQ
jgi:hypothetical protein